MPKPPDYYNILRLPPDATAEEIKASYKRLALKAHPDQNPSANAKAEFVRLAEAYQILIHPGKRAEYDQLRARPEPSAPRPQPKRSPRQAKPEIVKKTKRRPPTDEERIDIVVKQALVDLSDGMIDKLMGRLFRR